MLTTETRRSAGPSFGTDRHRAAGRRVAGRIREEVGQYLGQLVGVGPRRQSVRELQRDLETGPLESGLGQVERHPDGRREVELVDVGRADRRVAFGERVERARQPDEPVGLLAAATRTSPDRR